LIGWIDCEAGRRFSTLVPLPHRDKRSLDVPPKAVRIEQRECLAVVRESLLEFRQRFFVGGKPERQGLILLKRVRDELR